MVDVYIADHDKIDVLRQYQWEMPLTWLEGVAPQAPGEVFIDSRGVGMTTKEGQKSLYFSWQQSFRQWQKQRRAELLKGQLIKALGTKGQGSVIDATVGLGRDTSCLLAAGHRVIGYERQERVYFMLKAAQLCESFFLDHLILNYGPLVKNPERFPIYFDPMFDNGKKRKSLPHKGMSLFHDLIGGDTDAREEAKRLRLLTERLVIKRPLKGEVLLEKRNSCWEGKAVRFDLFLS